MAKVHLRKESGELIQFSYPFWKASVLLMIGIFSLIVSQLPQLMEFQSTLLIFSSLNILASFPTFFYRHDIKFLPNQRTFVIRRGIWPFTSLVEGPYEELIGVVVSAIEKRSLLTLGLFKSKRWECAFAFTSVDLPIAFFTSKNEDKARYQMGKFAKHFQINAFDRTDPMNIIEMNWSQFGQFGDASTENEASVDINFESPPETLSVEHGRKGFQCCLPLKRKKLSSVLTLIFGCSLFALSSFVLIEKPIEPLEMGLNLSLILFYIGITMSFLCFLAAAVGFFGKERILFYQGKIQTDITFFSIPSWEKSILIENIESIKVRQISKNSNNQKNGDQKPYDQSFELIVSAELFRLRFGKNHDLETLNWVRVALLQSIMDRDKVA